jgi:glycosyltransferase involved in cell wall biosynthesis
MARGAIARAALVICPRVPSLASGSAKRTVRLMEAMERAGVRPHVVSADPDGVAAAAGLRERGWRVDLLHEPPGGTRARMAQHLHRRPSPFLRSVAGFLQAAEPPAFVQAEHAMSAYYALRGPWVLSTHNVDSAMLRDVARGLPRGPARWRTLGRAAETANVERAAARRADALLCVSDADAAHFRALGAHPLVVPNGVDEALLDARRGPPRGEDVLFFGQLSYAPNALGLRRFLAEGWPRLAAARPAARLRIAGEGAGPDVTAAPRVDMLGFVPDLGAELERCALVVVPVWHGGGTRLKVLEALAAARPVVSTTLGASGIGFEAGRHGLLADTAETLADAAAAVLADPALAARLSAGGRELAERFRWTRVTAPAVELYASLASGRAPNRR